MKERVEVLLSCMNQADSSIAERSRLQTDVVIVNQCDKDEAISETYVNDMGDTCIKSFLCVTSRGLSRSRNIAIEHSTGDICMLSDDDEVFDIGYQQTIEDAYQRYPEADVIVFQIANSGKTYGRHPKKLGFIGAMKVGSWQISFRRKSILEHQISFDEEMGSGTGHGSCEEVKFLFDCLHHGLKIQYVPEQVASLNERAASQWFSGFTDKYFFNRGWCTRRFLGPLWATLYAILFALRKHDLYKHENSMYNALKWMLKGIGYVEYPQNIEL